MRYAVLVALLMVAGCADAEAVYMRNPMTGQTAQCGPYRVPGFNSEMAATMQQQSCVNDYKEQGFVRVAGR